MKAKKRILIIAIAVALILSVSSMLAYAYATNTLDTASGTLHMYGYLDFLEGTLVIKDKIWYNANIYGTYDMTGIMSNGNYGDANCCYVYPGTDDDMLSKEYLYATRMSVTSGTSGVYTGYGGTKGKMIMNLMGTKYTLYAS